MGIIYKMIKKLLINALLLGTVAGVLGTCEPVQAEGGDSTLLYSQYHAYDELGVQVLKRGSAHDVTAALADPTVQILIIQIPFESFDPACCADILKWVRAGHTLWFYDSRYAPCFGMKNYALSAKQFKGRPEKGPIGDVEYKGMACGVLTFSKHASMAGVGQCVIFLPLIGEDTYSAVAVDGDTVPLLQFAANSPALAALRRDGRGLILFKPLLWPDSLSGKRFQNNLLEYSAGFGVPGIGGEGRIGENIGPDAPYVEAEGVVYAADKSETLRQGAEPGNLEVASNARAENSAEVDSEAVRIVRQTRPVVAKPLDGDTSRVPVVVLSNEPDAKPNAGKDRVRPSGRSRAEVESWQGRGKQEAEGVGSGYGGAEYDQRFEGERSETDKGGVASSINPGHVDQEASSKAKVKVGSEGARVNEKDLVDVVTLNNGEVFLGTCRDNAISLETTSESFTVAPRELKSLVFTNDSWSLDKCETQEGRRVSGYMITEQFHFSNRGGNRTFKKSEIKNIRFNVPLSQVKH